MILISDFIEDWRAAALADEKLAPWAVTNDVVSLVRRAIEQAGPDYRLSDAGAIHRTAHVEPGAIVKPPVFIGPEAFVAATAYLRGGIVLLRKCIVGPACELKSTVMFQEAKVAHLSFVGDSLIGARANIEAGAIVANYRNEMSDKTIRIKFGSRVIETGVEKFGAMIGDDARIGANAVIAPGAFIDRNAAVARGGVVDQHPDAV
ncbi:MAG: transferase [Pseudomonadota bacterium]